MGGNKNDALAGSLSGFTVRALSQPLDVIKIRFQLQVENISRKDGGYYQSIYQACRRIVSEEGFTSLWKGHVPGQFLSVIYTSSEFYFFHALSTWSVTSLGCQRNALSDSIAGSVSGCITTFICQPIDVLRTRLVGQGHDKVYRGLCHGIQRILLDEGPLALWRGLAPSLLLIAPQTAISFATYEELKRLLDHSNSALKLAPFTGAFAGCLAKSAVYPLDVVKKRFQVVGFEEARRCFGRLPTNHGASAECLGLVTLACLRRISAEEGLQGLFKGWVPSMLKAAVTTGMTFTFFEFYRSLLA